MVNEMGWAVINAGLMGIMMILAAGVTGLLVLRARRDSHEPLLGPPKRKERKGPINMDEFAGPQNETEDPGLPPSVSLQNKIFGAAFARDGLKERR